ncbi:MAG: immunity 26/phosphotriesterase HocA family protein [Dehalococcoidia bacterium]|nr:immunity 26/phosphotriesterase HocA family protein [Dehalococcoidia bacterium]
MKRKAQKDKLGNIYAIPLPNRKFAFGRSMADADIAIYKHIGDTIEDIPKEEKYQFIVGVYKDVLTSGDWPLVENRPFKNEDESWPPPTFIWDQSTGKYNQYYKGQITPSTKAACKGLERCAVWDAHHIIDRIMGDDTWHKKATAEWAYIQRHGQLAFDEFTKNS